MQIIAPAKVNLCLDILKKDSTGYHQIETVFAQADFANDTLKIDESQEDKITSTHNDPQKTPIHLEENLVKKALDLLRGAYKIEKNFKVTLEKGIPIAAGLGGGSSDAAATLAALNELLGLNLAIPTLMSLAEQLGSDVPFFASQAMVALGTNYGEKITPLTGLKALKFEIKLLDQPKLSTADAYTRLDLSQCGQNREQTAKALEAIKCNDLAVLNKNLHNDFEQLYDVPKGWHLSGSGPAIFRLL